MTERMHEDHLDREIGRFLASEADDVGAAPPAMEIAVRVGSRIGRRAGASRLTPRLGFIALAGLLLVALAAGLVAVGMLLREPDVLQPKSRAYEAVFLRHSAIVGTSDDVVAVGVNAAGREREIGTLAGGWSQVPGPWGAVSPSGLLAMGSSRGETNDLMHWEIFDLHHPLAESIVIPGVQQLLDELRDKPYYLANGRGGAMWGPGDRLALMWYYLPFGGVPVVQVAFVDGRTGITTQARIPDGLFVLPYWASDGSGVLVSTVADIDAPEGNLQVLHPDGSVSPALQSLAQASCRIPSGFAFACLSPDDTMIFNYFAVLAGDEGGAATESPGVSPATTSPPGPGLIATGSGARFEIDGSFAGWLEVDR